MAQRQYLFISPFFVHFLGVNRKSVQVKTDRADCYHKSFTNECTLRRFSLQEQWLGSLVVDFL
jgi:hypothetical protein